MRLGLLSDTHLPNATFGAWGTILEGLRGVDMILHAGDIQGAGVLDSLESVAPVVAALGNNDRGPLEADPRVSPIHVLEIEGWRVGLVHDLEPEDRPMERVVEGLFRTPLDLVVSGHTHFERMEVWGGMVHINPGSPNLPHNYSHRLGVVGVVELTQGAIRADIVRLGALPGLPNPARAMSLEGSRGPAGFVANGKRGAGGHRDQ